MLANVNFPVLVEGPSEDAACQSWPAAFGTVLASATLSACGGGGSAAPPPAPDGLTEADAARFLSQASMGADRVGIARVQALGYAGWLDEQFELPSSASRWDWLIANGYADISNRNTQAGFDRVAWQKLIASPDTLRQRITLALSEIFVTAIAGLSGPWKQFAGASYLDLLEEGAFGSHRELIQRISLSLPMGRYLTYRGSAKENPASGALPDENYARELMQLFTIGLVELKLDATLKLTGNRTTDTYGQDDITGLARVFTGWDQDFAGADATTPDYVQRPMIQLPRRYETGAKTFLGTTIPAGTDALQGLTLALDAITTHPNVAPFFSRQLIQRLVTSNPSPAYVERVATVFNDDGKGARGNLRAVVRALLLDDEARSATVAASLEFGKLREPMLRLTAWARAFRVVSPSGNWNVGNTSDAGTALAQSPLRSPSVFNFFRPGYVPPNSPIALAALEAPEFQIANESSVVGYINFMQRAVAGLLGDLTPDYSGLLTLADDAGALLAELNLVLAANQISASSLATLTTAVQGIPSGTASSRRNRVNAALLMVLATPGFIVQK